VLVLGVGYWVLGARGAIPIKNPISRQIPRLAALDRDDKLHPDEKASTDFRKLSLQDIDGVDVLGIDTVERGEIEGKKIAEIGQRQYAL